MEAFFPIVFAVSGLFKGRKTRSRLRRKIWRTEAKKKRRGR